MKELEKPATVNTSVVIERQVRKNKLLGRVKIPRGHTLYEFNLATGKLNPAPIQRKNVDFQTAASGDTSIRKDVQCAEGCIYISALNEFNAQRKAFKLLKKK